jgi:hypothetical protein
LQGRGVAAAPVLSVCGCGGGALQQGVVDHGDDGGVSSIVCSPSVRWNVSKEVTSPVQRFGDPMQDKTGNQTYHFLYRLS